MKTWTRIIAALSVFACLVVWPGAVSPAQAATSVTPAPNIRPCPAVSPTLRLSAQPGVSFTLSPQDVKLAVAPGATFMHKVTVWNNSRSDLIVTFTHDSGMWQEWKHELGPTKVLLAPCGSAVVQLKGVAPDATPPATDMVKIYATSGNETHIVTLHLYLAVNH